MAALDRSLIAGLGPFAGLAPADLDEVLQPARAMRFARDATVFEQGGEARSFFLLLDGYVRVVRITPDGEQIIVRYIKDGELFGIAAAIGRDTYPANAVCAVDCVVLAWPTDRWGDLVRRFPSFASNTYQTIGNRLQETHDRMMEMSTEQVTQRVAHAVLRLAHQTGRKTAEGVEIDFPISRQDIAEMTGTTLHTVSRLLSAWEERGVIRSGRQKVIVTDPHRLMLIAENRGS